MSTPSNPSSPTRAARVLGVMLPLGALAVLAIWLYYPSLDDAMRSFDDQAWLRDTKVRNSITTMFDPRVRSPNPFSTTYYLPLQSALFWVMVELFGRSAQAFHVLCLGIHVAASSLVYLLTRTLTRNPWVALITGALFVAHVGHVQSVTWVSATVSHPLVTVFIVATMLAWVRMMDTGRRVYYFVALGSLLTGLLIRESAVIVPVLMVLLEAALALRDNPTRTIKAHLARAPRAALKYIPFVAMTLPIIAISAYKYPRGSLHQSWGGVSLGIHPLLRLMDFSTLLVYPAHQSSSLKLGLATALVLLGWGLFYTFRKWPLWTFCLLWIGIGLAPYTLSNFNPAQHIMRYLYPASVGYVLLLALWCTYAMERAGTKRWLKVMAMGVFIAYTLWHIYTLFERMY